MFNQKAEVGDIIIGEILVPCKYCNSPQTKARVISIKETEFSKGYYVNPFGCKKGHDKWYITDERMEDFVIKSNRTLVLHKFI